MDILLDRLYKAIEDTGLRTVVAGGGVAANSYLRRELGARAAEKGLTVRFPPLKLCGDNGAMVAGLGCRFLERGDRSGFDLNASARVPLFRRIGR